MPGPLDHSEACTIYEKSRQSDGMGGYITAWVEGEAFSALISLDSSLVAQQAEQQGVKNLYTVTVDKGFPIEFNDYFKRNSDGQTFRVTSDPDENATPNIATFAVKAFRAEKSALPK